MLDVSVTGLTEVVAGFDAMPAKVHAALVAKMGELEQLVIAKARDNLSGVVLNAKSGALRDSIAGQISDDGESVTATVGSYGVKYAAVQEYGATINIPDIVPTKAQALAFIMEGKLTFAKHVAAHTVTLPERSYLRSALDDLHADIVRGLGEAIVEAAIL